MSSKYVRQEYEYALSRRRADFVLPVYWEKPFPERPEEGLPPEELRRLHFEELSIAEEMPPREFARDSALLVSSPVVTRARSAAREVPTAELPPLPTSSPVTLSARFMAERKETSSRPDWSETTAGWVARESRRSGRSGLVTILIAAAILAPIIIGTFLGLEVTTSSGSEASSGGALPLLLVIGGVSGLLVALVLFILRRKR